MKKKILYTLFPCALLMMTYSMVLVTQSEEATEKIEIEAEENEEETNKDLQITNIQFTAGEADITEQVLLSPDLEDMTVQEETLEVADAEEVKEEDEYSNLAIADVDHYVNVRSTPGTDGEVVGKMYDGSVAQVLSVTGEGSEKWFQVVSGEVEGYIKAEYFIYGDSAAEVIDDYVTRYAVVKADRLNVRKEPDIAAPRIGYIDNGEKAQIIEWGEEWTKVAYTEGDEGYVASEYITVEEEFIYAKSIEEELAEQEEQWQLAQRAEQSEQVAPENTNIVVTPPSTSYTTNAELRAAIVQDAMQYLGNCYVHGGRSLASGTDCSGFTCYIYADFGYAISRTPQGQWSSNGRSISMEEIQPGDIVCYSSNGSKCTHVGLYIGNGQIIHEANSRKGVIVSNINYDNTFIGIKNVID